MTVAPASSAARRVVHVGLGDRSYDIIVGSGLLSEAGRLMADCLPGARAAIITDENVAALHLPALAGALASAGIEAVPIIMPAGETTKSFAHLTELVDRLLEARLERGDAVVALGGGVIGDLSGFAAGITRRGMKFVQVPTSLLAQVDSSVGGKTGINSPRGKNLIGVFYQPQLVLADTAILSTLSRREFAAGYAEVVKYGLIDRPDFFEWLEVNHTDIFSGGDARVEAVARCCEAKAAVVENDEREEGNRALLNLGHTFGHALESAVAYDPARLVHGEGVAIGMVLAHRFSQRLGLISGQDAVRVERHLSAVGLPTRIADIPGPAIDVDMLMTRIAQDKKVSRGKLTFILTQGIGQSFVAKDVAPDEVRAFLTEALAGAA